MRSFAEASAKRAYRLFIGSASRVGTGHSLGCEVHLHTDALTNSAIGI